MKIITNDEVIEYVEDLISKIEIDSSNIKFEFLKLKIEYYKLYKKLEDSENHIKELKKCIKLYKIKELSYIYS